VEAFLILRILCAPGRTPFASGFSSGSTVSFFEKGGVRKTQAWKVPL